MAATATGRPLALSNAADATREVLVSPHFVPRPGRSGGGFEYPSLSEAAEDRLELGATAGPAQDARRDAIAIPSRKRNDFIQARLNRSPALCANKIE
jgi:hypothetical protein